MKKHVSNFIVRPTAFALAMQRCIGRDFYIKASEMKSEPKAFLLARRHEDMDNVQPSIGVVLSLNGKAWNSMRAITSNNGRVDAAVAVAHEEALAA